MARITGPRNFFGPVRFEQRVTFLGEVKFFGPVYTPNLPLGSEQVPEIQKFPKTWLKKGHILKYHDTTGSQSLTNLDPSRPSLACQSQMLFLGASDDSSYFGLLYIQQVQNSKSNHQFLNYYLAL